MEIFRLGSIVEEVFILFVLLLTTPLHDERQAVTSNPHPHSSLKFEKGDKSDKRFSSEGRGRIEAWGFGFKDGDSCRVPHLQPQSLEFPPPTTTHLNQAILIRYIGKLRGSLSCCVTLSYLYAITPSAIDWATRPAHSHGRFRTITIEFHNGRRSLWEHGQSRRVFEHDDFGNRTRSAISRPALPVLTWRDSAANAITMTDSKATTTVIFFWRRNPSMTLRSAMITGRTTMPAFVCRVWRSMAGLDIVKYNVYFRTRNHFANRIHLQIQTTGTISKTSTKTLPHFTAENSTQPSGEPFHFDGIFFAEVPCHVNFSDAYKDPYYTEVLLQMNTCLLTKLETTLQSWQHTKEEL